jgi:Subtilase family
MTTEANFPLQQLCLKPSLYGRFSLDHLWPLLGYHLITEVLDSGVTQAHPLLQPGLDLADVHVYDANWPGGDSAVWRRHGTAMSGLALYGDLAEVLGGHDPIRLGHRLESVKMLAHDGTQHEPRLYEAITRECATRPEVNQPHRRRIHCLAITSAPGTNRGLPSSWSAAIDQLAYGDDTIRRLIVLATGNIRDGIARNTYLNGNDTEPVESPAQAWNALTVGAFTEKVLLANPSYEGWQPIAPAGELSPCSRTSVIWDRQWPIKPDVVFEGGNWAASGHQADSPDDLALLTTHFNPTILARNGARFDSSLSRVDASDDGTLRASANANRPGEPVTSVWLWCAQLRAGRFELPERCDDCGGGAPASFPQGGLRREDSAYEPA